MHHPTERITLTTAFVTPVVVKDHSDRESETGCCHMGYTFRLTARVLLYAPSQTG